MKRGPLWEVQFIVGDPDEGLRSGARAIVEIAGVVTIDKAITEAYKIVHAGVGAENPAWCVGAKLQANREIHYPG